MKEIFLQLEALHVRISGTQVIDNLNLTIHRGEQWALTGPSGSGKTVLAHTLLGSHFHSGEIRYPSAEAGHGTGDRNGAAVQPDASNPKELPYRVRIAMVDQQHRFRNRPGATELYYQQRFNSSDADQTITVQQELELYTGILGTEADEWLDNLHIRQLLSRPLIQLSNGENKRVQLAIALLEEPELLILDNPFLGLDVDGRAILHAIIDGLPAKGIQLLLITGPGELPAAITHVARLENGKLVSAVPRASFRPSAVARGQVRLDAGIVQQLQELSAGTADDNFNSAVRMVNVSVRYGDRTLLEHINWEVKKGERWNVSGPNGAGKSTILSLITGDNPQAYANEIWLFDRRRGSGETIWEIKKRIGFVSPELHLYFDNGATCFEVVASGLFDTIGLFRRLTAEQEQHTHLWMGLLSLGDLGAKRLAQLSTGQQRMVLLARALIKNPPMLILDEPCQGLDEEQTAYFRELVGLLCVAFEKTLIYVSHYRQELPECVDRYLKLDNGKMVS